MKRALRILPAAALVAMSVFGAMAPAASAAGTCPPSPTPGSTVNGNIEVTAGGTCVLDHVTVNGSVTVDPTAQLYLQNGAAVTGGITVGDSGLLQVAFGSKVNGAVTLNNASSATIAASTLGHGISGTANSWAIFASTINGPISLTNGGTTFLCGSKIGGAVHLTNPGLLQLGDPFPDGIPFVVVAQNGGPVQVYNCDGNVIKGSLSINNALATIEGNTISGTGTVLTLSNLTLLEYEGNKVAGNATCTSVLDIQLTSDDAEPLHNTYSGTNNGCPI